MSFLFYLKVKKIVLMIFSPILNVIDPVIRNPFFVQKNFIEMAPKSRISGIFLTKLALKNMGENNIINTD